MADNKNIKQQASLLKEAQSLGKALGLEYENIADLQKMILANQVKTTDQLMQQLKLARAAQDLVDQEVEGEKRKTAEKAKQNKLDAIGEDISAKLLRTKESIDEAQKSVFSNTEKTYKALKDSIKTRKQDLAKLIASNEVSQDFARATTEALNAEEKRIDALSDIQQQYQSQFETLTALGGFLSKNFGTIGKLIDGSINKGMSAFVDNIADGKSSSEAMQGAMKAFGGQATASITKMLGLVGIVTLLYDIFVDASNQAKELALNTGITFSQARKLADEARNVASSYGIQLATSTDILTVQQATITEFGTMAMMSTETAAQIADIGKSFGYGAQQAAQVNSQFMSMGMSGQAAASAQEELAANALKAGVSVGTVMKDITTNAKQASKYFGGNVKALNAAAVEAAKLGISLKDMTSISDKLLDIESSLQSQFELQAMTGKQINLDKARELALEGKISEASKAVYEQIGGIAEFEAMRPLERKKLAEMMGMEVSELEKSLAIQEKMGDLTEEELAASMNLGLSAAEISGMDAKQLKDKLAQQQSLEKASQSISAMKDEMMMALVPLAETLGAVFGTLAPLLKIAFTPLIWAGQAMKSLIDFAQEYSVITSVILGTLGLIWAGQNAALITETAKNIQYEIGFFWLQAQEMIEGVKLAIQTSSLTTMIAQGAAMVANTAKSALEGALVLGKAIASIFSSFAMIPFGIGIPLAIAAVGGLIAMFSNATSVGDAAFPAGSGTAIMSPREGAIFPSKNDDIAVGPGVIDAAQSGGGTTVVQQSGGSDTALITALMAKMDAIAAALATPVPVQIGDRVITEIGTQLAVNKTYRTGVGGR
jgi:hypothetical protein